MIESMRIKVRIMKWMLLFSFILLCIKFFAWWITRSNAILTDALESIVNVTAGSFALFSIIYASRPRDKEHPYGHGKIEFVSAGFEGALILLAGTAIMYEAILGFLHPHIITRIDSGAILSAAAGFCNFIMGTFLVKRGKKQHSALMKADGKHLISDSISSVGLVAGLMLIFFTKLMWIDNALAVLFGSYIIFTGVKIVRESLGNLLDEQDEERIDQLIKVLNEERRDKWIDMHNIRILKYGSGLHVDAHITLPWYLTLEKAHEEVDAVDRLVRKSMGNEMEFFIHSDPCVPTSCAICSGKDCPERKEPFAKKIAWSKENMLPDVKHTINSK
ncbi:MAG TPA: cation diffusion facilitator family transporter [Bacteroidia bacterium]|nr:cation diffusion facilitator family transporter [Bacteroidia bacterium]